MSSATAPNLGGKPREILGKTRVFCRRPSSKPGPPKFTENGGEMCGKKVACASLGFFGFSTRSMRLRQGPRLVSLPPAPAAAAPPLRWRHRGREWARAPARAPIGVSLLSGGDVAGGQSHRRPPARTRPRVSAWSFPVISQFLRISASRNRGTSFGREGAGLRLGLRSGCWCPASRFPTSRERNRSKGPVRVTGERAGE
jgi:hypothetical protein